MKKIILRAKFSDNFGFTLTEIIVVMAIISILAAIMVPSVTRYIDESKAKECEINRKSLVALLDSARAQNPDTTMFDIIKANPDISCPSTSETYEATDKDTIKCPFHDVENSAQSNDFELAEAIEPTTYIPPTSTEEISSNPESETSSTDNPPSPSQPEDEELSSDDFFEVPDSKGNIIRFSCKMISNFVAEYIEQGKGNTSAGQTLFLPKGEVFKDDLTGNYYIQYNNNRYVYFGSNNSYTFFPNDSNSEIKTTIPISSYEDNILTEYSVKRIEKGQIVQGPDNKYYVTTEIITDPTMYKKIGTPSTGNSYNPWHELALYQ